MSEVCQCPDKDHTIGICIGQIQSLQKEVDYFFKILRNHCEHRSNILCLIPPELHKRVGVKICDLNNCPIIKKE